MVLSQTKKDKGVYCCAYNCKNQPAAKKGGLCHKHYKRKRKKVDPVAVRFNNWKSKCVQRNIVNSVTLEEFRKFCERNGYIVVKGRRGMSATIDRRCSVHGYHIWNMQILTHRQNSSKGNKVGNNFECPF